MLLIQSLGSKNKFDLIDMMTREQVAQAAAREVIHIFGGFFVDFTVRETVLVAVYPAGGVIFIMVIKEVLSAWHLIQKIKIE
jgi:hypothetical protein